MQNNGSGATGVEATPISGPQNGNSDEARRSRKPANTKFKQQQLPAWQPMLTARSILPFLVAIGLAFLPIGIALYLSANNVTEVQVEYTNCVDKDKYTPTPCSNSTGSSPPHGCACEETFTLTKAIPGPVFMYYGLDNFYQNHRKYVKSRDDNQLMGQFSETPATECEPFATYNDGTKSVPIAPCGAVANSLFNDTISLKFLGTNNEKKSIDVALLNTGIAWYSDKNVKFRNPPGNTLQEAWKGYAKPRSWQKNPWELDESNPDNNGLKNEDFIVWMRTAAFPSFRKLYRRINHTADFADGLPAGNYSLNIGYNFPVVAFEGRKYVIISSVSWIGGRNIFLGVAYMTVGSCCLILAAVFFFIHVRWGKNFVERPLNRRVIKDTPFDHRPSDAVFALTDDFGNPSPIGSPPSSFRILDTIPSATESRENTSPSSAGSSPRDDHLPLSGSSSATYIPRERISPRTLARLPVVTTLVPERIGDSNIENRRPGVAESKYGRKCFQEVQFAECNEIFLSQVRSVSQMRIRRRPLVDLPAVN